MKNKKIVKTKLSVGKIILIIILVLLIGLGLFGAGCGGLFTMSSLLGGGGGYDFYIISVPSLIIGLLFIFGGYKGINKILKSRNIKDKKIEGKNIEKKRKSGKE